MVDKKQILALLEDNFHYDGTVSIDSNGLVSCTGNIVLKRQVHEIPVKFSRVDGNFYCNHNQLTTLKYSPTTIGGSFYCSINPLESLEGLPEKLKTLQLSYSPNLPLLRALNAKKIEFNPLLDDPTLKEILNRYAGQGEAGAFACGAELATAGYKENAQW